MPLTLTLTMSLTLTLTPTLTQLLGTAEASHATVACFPALAPGGDGDVSRQQAQAHTDGDRLEGGGRKAAADGGDSRQRQAVERSRREPSNALAHPLARRLATPRQHGPGWYEPCSSGLWRKGQSVGQWVCPSVGQSHEPRSCRLWREAPPHSLAFTHSRSLTRLTHSLPFTHALTRPLTFTHPLPRWQ